MLKLAKLFLSTLAVCSLFVACGDDGNEQPDARETPDAEVPDASALLFDRLGGQTGIEAVIDDFLAKVLANPEINGYFLNEGANYERLGTCLVKQVSALTGAPGVEYPGAGDPADADGCRNMEESHMGLGISRAEFDALAADLVQVLQDAGVAQGDINMIVAAVSPADDDIVEDADSNATIYQRLGRRPGIEAVIDAFLNKVVANTAINGFFLDGAGAPKGNVARLKVCLVRQVCGATGGPCQYGSEVTNDYESGVSTGEQCLDMAPAHMDLVNNNGDKISKADFDALVSELVAALDETSVAQEDKDAILGVLGGLCGDIVWNPAQGDGCPAPPVR
jgi:hemoglobin